MKMRLVVSSALLAVMVLVLAACTGEETQTPIATPLPVQPTNTITPTATAVPNPTHTPTLIPPTPIPVVIPTSTPSCESITQTPELVAFDSSRLRIVGFSDFYSVRPEIDPTIIGRVLNTSPLVVEVIDSSPDTPTVRRIADKYQIKFFIVDPKVVETLPRLKLHDLIELTMQEIIYGGGSAAPNATTQVLSQGVRSVKMIGDSYENLNLGAIEYLGRGPLLISYLSTSQTNASQLNIYGTGAMYYKDKWKNVTARQSLSPTELDVLLKVFTDNKFDEFEELTFQGEYSGGRSITLVCSRTQTVPLESNEAALLPITKALNNIVADLHDKSDYYVVFGRKGKVDAEPWPYPELPLADFQGLQGEAVRKYYETGVADDHIMFTPVPAELYDRLLPPVVGNVALKLGDPEFVEGGKVYSVSRRFCSPYSMFCKDGQLFALQVREFPLWPDHLGADLTAADGEGVLVENADYEENREFYERLSYGSHEYFQGTHLYYSIKLIRRER